MNRRSRFARETNRTGTRSQNAQWQKWGDLSNEAVLKSFGAVLVTLGFSGNVLQIFAVALTVIVMHLGCKAVCEEE